MQHPTKILVGKEHRPKPRRGRRKRWNQPFSELQDDQVMLIEMSKREAQDSVKSLRSALHRETKITGRRYSVYLCDEGLKVWLQSNDG